MLRVRIPHCVRHDKRPIPATLLAALTFLALPAVASAHAGFVRSDPPDLCGPVAVPRLQPGDPRCLTGVVLDQAPSSVRVTFSEAIQPVGRGIRVLSPSGRAIQQGKAVAEGGVASVPIEAAETGTYVVQWQVVSDDTHPVRGQFAFSVGQPSRPAASATAEVGQVTALGLGLQTLGRWLHFAGYTLAFGTVGLSMLLTRLAPAELPSPRSRWTLTNFGIVLLLVSEPVMLLGQTGSLGVDQLLDGDAIGDALASLFGRLLGFRLAAALLLWVIGGSLQPQISVAAAEEVVDGEDKSLPVGIDQRLATWAAIGLGLAVAAIDALGQHAASFRPVGLGLMVHALHLVGLALWGGGLAALVVAWKEGKPRRHTSRIAVAGLVLIAVSGLAMAVVHIGSPGALIASTYGDALLLKQAFLAAAVTLGWLAWKRAGKRRLWLGELSLLTALAGLAGLLVSLPPPR